MIWLLALSLLLGVWALVVGTWGIYMIRRLPERIVSELDTKIIEEVIEPVNRDGDPFSRPAHRDRATLEYYSYPPIRPGDATAPLGTHATREEHVLRRGVPGWLGRHVHGV
jgi:hypothetical protein